MRAIGFTAQRTAATLKTFLQHNQQNLEDLYEAYLAEPEVTKNQDYISRSRAAQDTLAEVLARDDPASAPKNDEA